VYVLNIIRVKFIRSDEIKYISHLDIMRTFSRAIRRSRIPIDYSKGFNPQPQMVFGLPLAVGVTSEAEYADFQLTDYVAPDDFVRLLNGELPTGLKIVKAAYNYSKNNIMSAVDMASYKIRVRVSEVTKNRGITVDDIKHKLELFTKMDNITVLKENKKQGEKSYIDIKPMIHNISVEEDSNGEYSKAGIFIISALLRAGGRANLKPDLLVEAINSNMNIDFEIGHIHRTGLFVTKNGKIYEPLDPQVLSENKVAGR